MQSYFELMSQPQKPDIPLKKNILFDGSRVDYGKVSQNEIDDSAEWNPNEQVVFSEEYIKQYKNEIKHIEANKQARKMLGLK